jgi:hypothetical protein
MPRHGGRVSIVSSTTPTTTQNCGLSALCGNYAVTNKYVLNVQVQGIAAAEQVTIWRSAPIGAPKGDLIFFTGGTSAGNYDNQGCSASYAPGYCDGDGDGYTVSSSPGLFDDLRNDGWRLWQVAWDDASFNGVADTGTEDERDGYLVLAARNDTVVQWIYDNFFTEDGTSAFCGVGNSQGTQTWAYLLAYYSGTKMDAVFLGSGAYGSRVDCGCERTNNDSGVFVGFPSPGRVVTDRAWGDRVQGTGPCCNDANLDSHCDYRANMAVGGAGDGTVVLSGTGENAGLTADAAWKKDSLLYNGRGIFYYPHTYVWMANGILDRTCVDTNSDPACSRAPQQQDEYYNKLMFSGQTLLTQVNNVATATHEMPNWTTYLNLLRTAINTYCVSR